MSIDTWTDFYSFINSSTAISAYTPNDTSTAYGAHASVLPPQLKFKHYSHYSMFQLHLYFSSIDILFNVSPSTDTSKTLKSQVFTWKTKRTSVSTVHTQFPTTAFTTYTSTETFSTINHLHFNSFQCLNVNWYFNILNWHFLTLLFLLLLVFRLPLHLQLFHTVRFKWKFSATKCVRFLLDFCLF